MTTSKTKEQIEAELNGRIDGLRDLLLALEVSLIKKGIIMEQDVLHELQSK